MRDACAVVFKKSFSSLSGRAGVGWVKSLNSRAAPPQKGIYEHMRKQIRKHYFWAVSFRVASPGLTPKAIPSLLTSIIHPTYPPHPFKTRLSCIISMTSIILFACSPLSALSPLSAPRRPERIPSGPQDLNWKIFQSSYNLTIIFQLPWVARPISSTQAKIRPLGPPWDPCSLSRCTAEC